MVWNKKLYPQQIFAHLLKVKNMKAVFSQLLKIPEFKVYAMSDSPFSSP